MTTIRMKLYTCLGALALVTAGISATSYAVTSRDQEALATILADRVEPLKSLKVTADSYAVGIVDAAHKARNGNMTYAQAAIAVRDGSRQIEASWGAYRATKIEGEEEQLARDVEQQRIAADKAVAELQAILARNDSGALDRFVTGSLYQAIDPVSSSISKLVDLQIEIAKSETTDALSFASKGLTSTAILALIGLMAVLGSFVIVARMVLGPLLKVREAMAMLAGGNNRIEVPGSNRVDEIGAMAKAVVVFRDAAQEQERAAAEKARADADQQRVVSVVGDRLTKLAAGDLTARIDQEFPPSYVALKSNFNDAVDKLRELISAVAESASQIKTGSGEIAQAAEDLARRTESNAASLEETSAAVSEMDGRLKATAQAADQTLQRADQTTATVETGRSMTDKAVAAMNRVGESAKGIDNVIEGLDKIAFQTRVLAMNAAVEAGRAGEAGRGFAVVADLVSALAMRAEEESKRARDQLTVTQTEINQAVEVVGRVDGALAAIASDVGEVNSLLARIASDNQSQASAVTQISAAVSSMDVATQQNAAMVEETSAAARNLSTEVLALAEQASRFSVGHRAEASSPRGKIAGAVKSEGNRDRFAGSEQLKPLPKAAVTALTAPADDWTQF